MEGQAPEIQSQQPEVHNSQEPVVETPAFKGTKHKVKIDQKELEVDYDDLVKGYQLQSVSTRKAQEAAALRKEVDQFIDLLKSGHLDVFEQFVPEEKLHEYAFNKLKNKVEWEELPEEMKRLKQTEKELEKYKKKEEEYRTREQQAVFQQEEAKAVEWLDTEIQRGIEKLRNKYGNIVITADIVQEIARAIEAHELSSEDGGDPNWDIDTISEKTWGRWSNKMNKYFSALSADELKKILTKDQLKSLRQSELNAALAQAPQARKNSKEYESIPKDQKYKNFDDKFEDYLNRRIGRK